MGVVFPYTYKMNVGRFYSYWPSLLKSKNYFFIFLFPSIFPGTQLLLVKAVPWMNGWVSAVGDISDICHSPLLSEIRNRKEEVYWELFVIINYFVLHLFWLCLETYLFHLG